MKTTIDVTHWDIENGKKASDCLCPIALATKRKLKHQYLGTVAVNGAGIRVNNQQCDTGYAHENVTSFIRRFDSGRAVSPMSITVDIPYEALNPSQV